MVDDISKLRPELLKKSPAELKRQRDEIDLAIAELERQELVKAKSELAEEINRHVESALESIKFLKTNERLPERIVEAFSRSGVFSPTAFLKAVTPEDLVGGRRPQSRKRLTAAEREAAIAAGTLKPRVRRKA